MEAAAVAEQEESNAEKQETKHKGKAKEITNQTSQQLMHCEIP